MTKRDYIRALEEKGLLKIGLGFGVISVTMLTYAEMFDYYSSIAKNAAQAAKETSLEFRVCEQTVWRAIRSMRETHKSFTTKRLIVE